MPEGDTVYALARRLDDALTGRTLVRGELRVPAHATDDLAGYAEYTQQVRFRLIPGVW